MKRFALSMVSALMAAIVSAILPQQVVFQGHEVGDAGIALAQLMVKLSGGLPYSQSDVIVGYPFTASVVLGPFAFISLDLFAPIFSAITTFILTYTLLKNGEVWRLWIFTSLPFIATLYSSQWAILFLAAYYIPALFPVVLIKPQLSLFLIEKFTKWSIAVMAIILIVSLAIYPMWPIDFVKGAHLNQYTGWLPILTGPGILLALGLFKIKSKSMRTLLALSITPQRLWYDQLLLASLINSRLEAIAFVVLSWTAFFITYLISPNDTVALAPQTTLAKYLVVCLLPTSCRGGEID